MLTNQRIDRQKYYSKGANIMNSKYTPETKQQIFAHLESRESVDSIAKNIGIPQSTIYSWIKTAKKDSECLEIIKSSDYKTLQRQNERLKLKR